MEEIRLNLRRIFAPRIRQALPFSILDMKKLLMLGFVAGALLSVSACSNPDLEVRETIADTVPPLPELPAVAAGADSAAVAEAQARKEVSAVNATEAIKRMQPVM
jgi:hypothetical protein